MTDSAYDLIVPTNNMSSPENTRTTCPNIPVRIIRLGQAMHKLKDLYYFLNTGTAEVPDFMAAKVSPLRVAHLREHHQAIMLRIELAINTLQQKRKLMRDLAKTSVVLARVNLLYADRPKDPILGLAQTIYAANIRKLLIREQRKPKNS